MRTLYAILAAVLLAGCSTPAPQPKSGVTITIPPAPVEYGTVD